MKKLLILLISAFSICIVHAQEASGGFRRAGTNAQIKGMHKTQLKDSLGLTGEQANSVDAIQQDFKLKMRAVKLDTQTSEADKKTKLAELNQERVTKLSAVISKEQIAKMDGTKKQVKQVKHKKHRRSAKRV